MTDKVDTTYLAFSWAAIACAETFLHSLSRNSPKARSHAELLIEFVKVGKLGAAPSHYINTVVRQYPDLAIHQTRANRELQKLQTNPPCKAAE